MARQDTHLTQTGEEVQALLDKVEGIEAGAEVNEIESIEVNGTAQTPDANRKVAITVPTALGDLSQDTTHRVVTDAEKAAWSGKYDKPAGGIPGSDIADGVIPDTSAFITKSVNDLVNYYLKSETYTKEEVGQLIGAISQFHYEIYASTSAVTSPASNVLYLIGPTGSGADKYEEYVYANNTWTKIGDTSVDLSGYVTTTALNTALAAYTATANLAAVAISGSYNDLSNKPSIPTVGTLNTNNATAQSVNSSESLSGTVKLHKVSKTGNYNDLLNKPTIPTLNMLIVAVGYDDEEEEYSITNDVTYADICDAYDAGKGILLVYTDSDGYASEYTLSDYAADDDYINFSDSQSPEVVKTFTINSDGSIAYATQTARTSALTNDSLFVRGMAAIWRGTCATSSTTAAKYVTCASFTADDQVVGVMVVVTFSNTNAAAPNILTLNVQSRGAKPIKRWVNGGLADIDKPENLTGTMVFVYDGTNWVTWYESFDDIDGNCLNAKFGDVTLKQWRPDYTMTEGSYVKGADGLLYEYTGAKYVEVPVGDAERVRFLGLYPKYSSWTNGWAFGKYVNDQWVTIESEKFEYDTSQDASYTKEYIKDVPSGATHFRTSSASSSLYALERQFYLYLQTGKPAVSQEELYDEVHPAIATTQPNGGFLPNVVYDLGTLTGTVTFALASPTDNTIANPYHWTFETSSTAPTITWPSGITWAGGSAPTINANSHYEILVRKGYATSLEF